MLNVSAAAEYNLRAHKYAPVQEIALPVAGSDSREAYNPRLLVVPNGYAVGEHGIPITQDGCIIKDSLMWENVSEEMPTLETHWAQREKMTRINGQCMMLYGRWSENFYHWIWENVPAILLAESSGYRGNYATRPTKYIPQIFELLGVSLDRVFSYQGGSFQVEQLVSAVRPSASMLADTPGLFMGVRNQLIAAAGGPIDTAERRFYISRGKSNRPRQVINEDEVIKVLAPLGFEPICLEDYTVREQIRLMSTASAIVGPHGAGVTQCIFARPGGIVVEFFAPNYVNTAIIAALKHLRLKYYPLTSQKWTDTYPHGDHVVVYTDLLAHIISMELETSSRNSPATPSAASSR